MKLLRSFFLLAFVLFILAGAETWLHAEVKEAGYRTAIRVKPLLRTTTTTAGQPIVYPKIAHPEVRALLVEIPPGAETGWHLHPVPCYAYVISGSLEVELEGGAKNRFTAGQALVESVNLRHNGRNIGPDPVKLVMFVTSEKEKPFTIAEAVR